MTPDYSKPPYSYFVPPGKLRVSAPALQMAREFAGVIGQYRSGRQIVAFDWGQTSVREKPGLPMRDLGECLMIVAYLRSEVPREVVHLDDGLEFAIKMPSEVWTRHHLIDVDATQFCRLALR